MAQLTNNPWSYQTADIAIATITGATGLTLNADGTVSITTTGALTFNATADSNTAFTVFGATSALYNGFYTRISGASGASAFVMQPNFVIPAGTAQSGGGTIAQVLYRNRVRMEDISWQSTTGSVLVATDTLELRDRNGNIIWNAIVPTGPSSFSQNRGKIYWVSGLVPTVLTHGIVLMTVN
jgi:hypothetical protein